jgi:hypothetical protein
MANIDINDIIPRAYDLTSPDDMLTFLDDYRYQKAESILKKLYYDITGLESVIYENPNEYRPLSSTCNLRNKDSKDEEEISSSVKSPAVDDEEDKERKAFHNEFASSSTPALESESVVFDVNKFILPTIPSLYGDIASYSEKLSSVKINSVIFEITCQLLENQLKGYHHDEEGGEEEGEGNKNDINVCDYDYCPSGYHEINVNAAASSSGVIGNNNNTTSSSFYSSSGINPYLNYPKSVINGIRLISDLHWEIIDNYSISQPLTSTTGLPLDPPEPLDNFIRNANAMYNNEEEYDEITGKKYTYQQLQREKRRLMKLYEEQRELLSNEMIKPLRTMTMKDLYRIHKLLCKRILYIYGKSQSGLNGCNSLSQNLWIVKPAAKSRGRGIMTFSNITKLLKYIDAGNGLSTQWIVQKYMENSLLIAKRKFDFRQWVLVTNWNPLTIYFYNECYARFSVDEYTTNINDLENLYIHLVNNSIGKNSENFNKIILAENGDSIDGYMWSFKQFQQYLKWKNKQEKKGSSMNNKANGSSKEEEEEDDVLVHKIQPRMKEIAIYSLMCASEAIEHRKNSWELYGFDYMIDANYNTWLIEINSSPACDYSTKVTERYVQKALVELLSVVLDVREWEALPKKQRGEKPNTGGWEMIYQGPQLELPLGSFGTEMSLKGEGIKGLNQNSNYRRSIPVVTPSSSSSTKGIIEDAGTPPSNSRNSFSQSLNPSSMNNSLKKMMNKTTVDKSIPQKSLIPKPPPHSNNNNASFKKKSAGSKNNSEFDDEVAFEMNDDDDEEDVYHHGGGNNNVNSIELQCGSFDDSIDGEPSNGRTLGKPSTKSGVLQKLNSEKGAVKKEVTMKSDKAVVAVPIKTFNVDF